MTSVRKLSRDDFASKRSITHAILGLFQEDYKPACHAYSAIVDSFVIVSFFPWEHYIPQYYRWLTCYVCARLRQCFGQDGCYFGCDTPWTCSYTRTQRFCHFAVAHILTPSVKLAFGPKSGFKNKCLCGYVCRANKGRFKGYILHPPTVNIDWNHFVK